MESTHRNVLVRVSGRDRPGIATALLTTLAGVDATVVDIEQISMSGRLDLTVLISIPPGHDTLKELLFFGWENDCNVDFDVVEPADNTLLAEEQRYAVTVLGTEIGAAALAAATKAIATSGANIERIIRLSRFPVVSYEFIVSGGDESTLRSELVHEAHVNNSFDAAVQREGLSRRALRLVAIDMDSTLIQDEVIDLVADEIGCGEEVAELTERAMAGELDFTESLRARVALFAGAEVDVLERAQKRVQLTRGSRTFIRTLRRLGFTTMLVSGGFDFFTAAIAEELGIDHAYANKLEIVDNRLTGRLVGPIVDRERKGDLLRSVARAEGITLDQTVAVGDGANDLAMLEAAGLGVAFNAKQVVREAADTSLTVPYLDAILFVLGVRRSDVEGVTG